MARRANTFSTTATDDEVLAALRAYDTATSSGDIDGQVDFFADSWRSSSGTTKADMREQLQRQADRGADQDKRFVLDDAKVVVDGGSATVDPVKLRSPTGNGSFEFSHDQRVGRRVAMRFDFAIPTCRCARRERPRASANAS